MSMVTDCPSDMEMLIMDDLYTYTEVKMQKCKLNVHMCEDIQQRTCHSESFPSLLYFLLYYQVVTTVLTVPTMLPQSSL